MVVITEIDCESNVFWGGGDLSIISFKSTCNCIDYHKKSDYQVFKSVNEEGNTEKRSTVDLLEWLKINGFSQKSVNNEHVFVNVNESKPENKDSKFMVMDTINDSIIIENTVINTESVNGHVDEQTQIEVKDYPAVIFPDTFVAPEIDIEFGSLGPFNKIHNGDMKIEPNCGAYNNSFDVNEIKSVSSLETESETETQKSVLSVEEKHSDDQTEKEAVENNQIMETEEPTEITGNKEIEITDEKTTEVMEYKQSGKTDEISKEEIEEENMKAKKAMRKKRKAEEARMRAEKRAEKEAEERAQKELKEAEEKEKARLKRLNKKGKKRTRGATSSSNFTCGDVAESNESKEIEYTNEKQDQCSPPRAPAAAMTMRNKGRWRQMVVAGTLIPAMFVLHITSFF